jgi:signal transduction histidine kinase
MTTRDDRAEVRQRGALAVALLGAALVAGFAWNFLRELSSLSTVAAPAVTFLFGAALSGALVYAGVRWMRGAYTDVEARRAAVWCYGGAVAFTAVVAFTVAVRLAEGRTLAEPLLELLVAAGGGAVAGLVAGHQNVEVYRQVGQAERARDSMVFLNRTLRHEVANGVQLVEGYAGTLRDQVKGDDADAVQTIRETSEELAELIDDVGRVADVHAGTADLESVDVVGVLQREADSLEGANPEATVETDLPDGAAVRASDAVAYVFRNLLANAAEHAGEAPTVWVSVDVGAEVVSVEVADDGPGVPDGEKADLFDPEEGGTHGFGLHLVRTLVEGYGGEVRVGNGEPTGAVFAVDLPRPDTPRSGLFDGGSVTGATDLPTGGSGDERDEDTAEESREATTCH